jgi:hypothetical protein
MRRIAIILCLLIMTAGFSGCFGGTDVEIDGGGVEPGGELTDDWPTYYVLTAADLPTCDANTLGRLYYVEADTNFQACTSTGWTVVQIGGSGSTSVLNSAPVLSASVWYSDDDMLADDGDGTYSRLVYIDWVAMDLDGTIVSLGIDYDGDGVIDIPFSKNSGLFSDQTTVQAQGEEWGGAFIIPIEVGSSIHQVENYMERECALIIQSTLVVMAVDDDGATTYNPMVFDPFSGWGQLYYPISGWKVSDPDLSAFSFSQADVDWVTGASSSCPSIPQLSFADHPDSLTTGQSDNLAILTVDDPGDWANEFYLDGYCVDSAGDATWLEDEVYTFTGADEANPQAGEYWTVSEGGQHGSCDSGTTGFIVTVNFGDEKRITHETAMS